MEFSGKRAKEMISDDFGKTLHDRATRGEALSDKEQTQLESWYERQDNIENDILGATTDDKIIAKLQVQIETALTQLMTITKRIQEVSSENESLRQEIIGLRRQLVDSSTMQPAA